MNGRCIVEYGAHWRDDGGGLLVRHDASDADDVRLGDERHEAHGEEVLHELPRGRREADADATERGEDDREGALRYERSVSLAYYSSGRGRAAQMDTWTRVEGTRVRVHDTWTRVEGTRVRVHDTWTRVEGTRVRVHDTWTRVEGTRVAPAGKTRRTSGRGSMGAGCTCAIVARARRGGARR